MSTLWLQWYLLPVKLLILLEPSSPLEYLQCLFHELESNFTPSWPLSGQLAAFFPLHPPPPKLNFLRKKHWVPATLHSLVGTPYSIGTWPPSHPGYLLHWQSLSHWNLASLSLRCLLPFSLVGAFCPIGTWTLSPVASGVSEYVHPFFLEFLVPVLLSVSNLNAHMSITCSIGT